MIEDFRYKEAKAYIRSIKKKIDGLPFIGLDLLETKINRKLINNTNAIHNVS